jgi:hypothetical protein
MDVISIATPKFFGLPNATQRLGYLGSNYMSNDRESLGRFSLVSGGDRPQNFMVQE